MIYNSSVNLKARNKTNLIKDVFTGDLATMIDQIPMQ